MPLELAKSDDGRLAEVAKKEQGLRAIEKKNQDDLQRIKRLEEALQRREEAIGERERFVEKARAQLAEAELQNQQIRKVLVANRQDSREDVAASWERFISSAKARVPELKPDYEDFGVSFGKDDVKTSDSLKSKFVGTVTVNYVFHSFLKTIKTVTFHDYEVRYNFGFRNGTWFFMDGVARWTLKHTTVAADLKSVEESNDMDKIEFGDLCYDKTVKDGFRRWGAILFGQ